MFFCFFAFSTIHANFPPIVAISLTGQETIFPSPHKALLCFAPSSIAKEKIGAWHHAFQHNKKINLYPISGIIIPPNIPSLLLKQPFILRLIASKIPSQYQKNIYVSMDPYETLQKKLNLPENTENEPHFFLLEGNTIVAYTYGSYSEQKIHLFNSALRYNTPKKY